MVVIKIGKRRKQLPPLKVGKATEEGRGRCVCKGGDHKGEGRARRVTRRRV